MTKLKDIKESIRDLKDTLHSDYGVSNIEVFGSWVRNEQKDGSDLDVLIEVDRDVSLLDVVGLEQFLTDELGLKVDVVLRRSVRPELRDIIFGEAIPV